jgi:WD40 repeat protein
MALSPDGRRVVSGNHDARNKDKMLRVWNIDTGECLKVLEGHVKNVQAMAFSPDARLVVSGSADKTLRIWDSESGACLRMLEGHEGQINSLALSPDGHYLMSMSRDGTLRFWDIETGECLSTLFRRNLATFDFDPLSGRLSLGFTDGRVEFFSLENLPGWGPFVTTAYREIVSQDLPVGSITAMPVCCGQRIEIPPGITERIGHWMIQGGEGAYSDPTLLLDCPHCGTPLRMNPFFVDITTIR